MEGLKVRCRSCGSFDLYETTETYDPNIPLNGSMLRLQKPYDSFNWEVYDGALADKSTSRFLMFCTRCGGYITATGELLFVDESFDIAKAIAEKEYVEYSPEIPDSAESDELAEYEKRVEELDKKQRELDEPLKAEYAEFICPVPGCGKPCASKAGLMAHIRLAHKNG